MVTGLTKKLSIEAPIIQAPMAGVSTPALAAAVSNAGALGSLAIGAMSVEEARSAIQETQAKTSRPFNVNVFCHKSPPPDPKRDQQWLKTLSPFFQKFGVVPPAELKEIYPSFNQNEAMLNLLLETRPQVVSFHFGLPSSEYIEQLKKAGVFLIASATNLEEAKIIEEAGLDAIIAQGYEAGGHRGMFNENARDIRLGTLALTKLLVQNTNLPIIASGGIMDGAGITAVLALGAQAAQLGTAFISCPESAADDGYRQALKSESAQHTVMTKFISGRPARGLPNRLTALENDSNISQPASYPLAYDAAKTLHTIAKAHGSEDFVTRWAGQAASLSREMPAGKLIGILGQEIAMSLRQLSVSD